MKLKIILVIALAIMFIFTSIMSIISIGGLINTGLEKLLGYDNCLYAKRVVEKTPETTKPDNSYCINDAKRKIAHDLGLTIVALPLSIFFYYRTKKTLKR